MRPPRTFSGSKDAAAGADRKPNGGPDLSARLAALTVFQGVVVDRRSVDDGFETAVAILEPRDRAFVRLLVATALRRLGQIDAVLAKFIDREPAELIRDILRLGATQLLFLSTPPHAAVATTVGLVRARGYDRMTGMVNAVMRRVAEQGAGLIAEQNAARLTTVDWLWHSWAARFGVDGAAAIALAHLGEPPLDLTVKDPSTLEAWAEKLDATILPTGTLRRFATGRVTDIEGFADGAWWVQDAAAALPAKILLSAMADPSSATVVDLCAAPGGKTAQLIAAGCTVTAVDVAEPRLKLLRDNLARLHQTATVAMADAVAWRPPAPVDAVLLDAPCSATGTLRRHPDLPHLKQPADIAGFAENQRRLLFAAIEMVKPGGLILYSVCSLQPDEGPSVVKAIGDKLERVPITAEMVGGASELLTPDGELRTLPSHWAERGGMDGFYGVLLRKPA